MIFLDMETYLHKYLFVPSSEAQYDLFVPSSETQYDPQPLNKTVSVILMQE